MDFVECYLCGGLAVQESVSRELTATIFCTNKVCGRYDITLQAMQALQAGASLIEQTDEISSRVYLANRHDERILICVSDLLIESSS